MAGSCVGAGRLCGLRDSAALLLKRRIAADLVAFFGEDVIRRLLDATPPRWQKEFPSICITMRYKSCQPPYAIPEVMRMRSQGKTHSEIADHYHVSTSRVGQVIRKEKERVLSSERAESLRRQIRACHDLSDLDKTIPADDPFAFCNSRPLSPRGPSCPSNGRAPRT
jgi:hypothetical protein